MTNDDLRAAVASEEAATRQVFDLLNERARLRKIIMDAPHAFGCAAVHLGLRYNADKCTCWKSEVQL